jgi:RNA-directed DNA polymerase
MRDAVAKARERCWRNDWVLDLDIKGFFDSLDWELTLAAVRRHTNSPWVLLYIERWLKAPVQMEDGSIVARTTGTPQGGVISPLLANLFLHHAFDMWMTEKFPHIPFERYADDAICHCRSEAQARFLQDALTARLTECKLTLHPENTRIVYCRDVNRKGDFPVIRFDFLGFEFRAGKVRWVVKGNEVFAHSFLPAVSPKAQTRISREIRRWALHHRSDKSLEELARMYNPVIRGWIGYYSHFYRTQIRPTLKRIDAYVIRWAAASTSGWFIRPKAGGTGSTGSAGRHRGSSPIGRYVMATAGHREPCDSRGSCTVLGAAGGESPPADSPTARMRPSAGHDCSISNRDRRRHERQTPTR